MPSLPETHRRSWLQSVASLGASGWASVALDFAARAAAPATLLGLVVGAHCAAWLGGLATQLLVVLRGAAAGRALEARLIGQWSTLVHAAARQRLDVLEHRGADANVSLLVFAAQRTAQVEASTLPRVVADAIGLLVVAAAVVGLLGVEWLLLGGLLALAAAPLLGLIGRRLRRAEQRGHDRLQALVDECSLLVEGAADLRAHDRAEPVVARALERATELARVRREATMWRALGSLLPLALAVLAVTSPATARWLPVGSSLATAAVLGATAVAFGLGFVSGIEELAAAEPQRRMLARFTAPAERPEAGARTSAPGMLRLREGALVFDRVSIRHDGSARATPCAFDCRWHPQRGLALVGANGAGKTSLVRALLGLLPLESGAIRIGERAWSEDDAAALRAAVVFVPQRPFVAPSRSVAWHLRLLCEGASDGELEAALDAVGLLPTLRKRSPASPLEVSAGRLSGGERARMHLARALIPRHGRPPEFVIIDEPEAGLDAEGRTAVQELLLRLSAHTPVILIAHDLSVVPPTFLRAACAADG